MRVVIINSTTDLYGANRILSQSIFGFPSSCEIEIWLPNLDGPLLDLLRETHQSIKIRSFKDIPIIQRKMFTPQGVIFILSLIFRFYKILKYENKKEKINLLYVNTLSNFFILPISWFLKIYTLVHVHEILESPRLIGGLFSRYAVFFSDRILCVSNAVVKGLKKWSSPKFDHKISCIYNGIPDLYNPEVKKASNETSIYLTLIARIKPEKGIWFFLEALKEMEHKDLVLARIIGGPAPFGDSYVSKLKDDIKDFPLSIEYIPFLKDISWYLNQTDVLVVPSLMKDPFPTTVLEGMACGKAVIASDTGGAAEAISHLHTGILISSSDVKPFASYLDQLVIDRSLRQNLGHEARISFLKNFNEEVFRKNLNEYFSKILNN
jgi:glycosyltransferase involved in cell wall biosynthesis